MATLVTKFISKKCLLTVNIHGGVVIFVVYFITSIYIKYMATLVTNIFPINTFKTHFDSCSCCNT